MLFKKIGDIKGIFHVEIGIIKEKNSKYLIEAEEIKKGGKNTQNYTKNILMTQITMMVCVINHLEPDMLEEKVK